MRSGYPFTLLSMLTIAIVGCSKKADDAKPAPGSAVGVEQGEPLVVPTEEPMTPGASASGINLTNLGPKLQYQKEHRGAGPSSDKVFAALEQGGYKLDERRQVLGDAASASYCEGAHVSGLGIVVCEYASDKAAAAGKAKLEKDWKQLDGTVERVIKGASIITVIHGGNKTADVPKILALASAT